MQNMKVGMYDAKVQTQMQDTKVGRRIEDTNVPKDANIYKHTNIPKDANITKHVNKKNQNDEKEDLLARNFLTLVTLTHMWWILQASKNKQSMNQENDGDNVELLKVS